MIILSKLRKKKQIFFTDGPSQYNWLFQEVRCRLSVCDRMSPIFLIKYFFQRKFRFSVQQKLSQKVPAFSLKRGLLCERADHLLGLWPSVAPLFPKAGWTPGWVVIDRQWQINEPQYLGALSMV